MPMETDQGNEEKDIINPKTVNISLEEVRQQ